MAQTDTTGLLLIGPHLSSTRVGVSLLFRGLVSASESRESPSGPPTNQLPLCCHTKRRNTLNTRGYLEHLDLGTDPDSGQPNVLVTSSQEYHALSDEEKARSWATIKVASEILERVTVTMYHQVYSGKIPTKTIKKNPWNRRGLTLVKVPQNIKTKEDRRKDDITRIVPVARRALEATGWLPENQQFLVRVLIDTKLRNIERELFGRDFQETKDKQLTEEGKHGITNN